MKKSLKKLGNTKISSIKNGNTNTKMWGTMKASLRGIL